MDPLSAAAGTVAFITVAVQSAKVIFDVLSAITDSPKHVRDVGRDVEQLRLILIRLSKSQCITQKDHTIAVLLRRCSEDISLYARRLLKMQVSPTERRSGKLWKKFTAVISEKDLQAMVVAIHCHVSSLGLHLNLVQVDLIWESQRYLQALTSAIVAQPLLSVAPESGPAGSACLCALSVPEGRRHVDSKPVAMSHQMSILEGLVRLPQLINTENHILRSIEARAVVDGLERLLYAALEHLSAREKRGRTCTDIELELKLIKGLITSSKQISINKLSQTQSSQKRGAIVHQQRKRKRIVIDEGLMMLTSLKRSRLPTVAIPDTSTCAHFEAAGQEFLGTVTFFPTRPLSSLMIIASVHQKEVHGGTYCEIPRLYVSRLLPSDAPVFNLAREGKVEDLRAMISLDRASLRDRDINGMTLLHYAVGHPPMCRFLIDSGADVNEIAGKNDQAESLPLLAATTRATTSIRGSAEFEAARECIAILLRSGADPTISLKSWDSPFHVACTPKDIDILDIFLKLGSAFAHLELADSRGRTPLLRMCLWYSTYTRHAFSHLTDCGADISARDNTGATCLHLAIENAKRPLSDEFEALAYLVRCGANVYATTTEGISVSEVAYTTSSTDVVYKLGSYRGDLWDTVLATAGYDVASFRGDWPREKFTARYTRSDFEKLWSGQEHLCPYFDGPDSVSSNDDVTPRADDTTTAVTTRRSFESSIRQRTDISVTIESMKRATLNNRSGAVSGEQPQYEQYEGSCVASHSLFVDAPGHQVQVPLLWDPSLVHHLMPNPWHDIIPQDGQGNASRSMAERAVAEEAASDATMNKGTVVAENQRSNRESELGHELGKPCWDGIELENVWED